MTKTADCASKEQNECSTSSTKLPPSMIIVRWLLVIPSAVGGWYLAFVLGLLSVSALDLLCPMDQMVSEICIAPWYAQAQGGLIMLFTGLSAVFAISSAFLVTPVAKWKLAVAYTTLSMGVIVAAVMAYRIESFFEFACAASFGVMTCFFFRNRALRIPP